MAKSSVKSHLHEQLKLHGHIPAKELQSDTASDLPVEARVDEHLSAAGAMKVPSISVKRTPQLRRSRENEVKRPALLEAIMEAEYSGVGWDADAEATKKLEKDGYSDDEH